MRRNLLTFGAVVLGVAAAALPAHAAGGRGNGRVAHVVTHANGSGNEVAGIGDLDADGIPDLAVGSPATNQIEILFMAGDGSLRASRTIGAAAGGFTGALDPDDRFGDAIDVVGDVDGDTIQDLVVGAWQDDDFWDDSGALWVLFMNRDGTVRGQQKISSLEGGLAWLPQPYLEFGRSVAGVGDLDDDGTPDVVVGAPYLATTAPRTGGIYVLHLHPDGTVKTRTLISSDQGGFVGPLDDYDLFGMSVAPLGDFDGDGTPDVVVGVEHDDDGASFTGALWLLMLHADGTVKSQRKISATAGGLTAPIDHGNHFGHDVTALGDVDGDGVVDIAAIQYSFDDNRLDGVVWVLFLRADGTVKSFQRIDDAYGGLAVTPDRDLSAFPGIASAGDLDGDGIVDLTVGTPGTSGLWILFGAGAPGAPCENAPRAGCLAASRARIGLQVDKTDDAKDRLTLSWKGLAPGAPALGDPTSGTGYALCLYDHEGGVPVHVASVRIAAGARWRASSPTKFKYDDPDTAADGVRSAKVSASPNGRVQFALSARGLRLPAPVGRSDTGFFASGPGVTAQITNDAGACWTADFTRATHSSLQRFLAAAP